MQKPVIINLVAAKHKHVTAMRKIKLIVDSESTMSYNKIAVTRMKVTLSREKCSETFSKKVLTANRRHGTI